MMDHKQAEALRDNLANQVEGMKKDKPKAFIAIFFPDELGHFHLTFRFTGMGPGESLDRLNDIRGVLHNMAKEPK